MTPAAPLGIFGTMRTYPVRAYLYSRVSTPDQRHGRGIARQTDWAREWCRRKGIDLDETLTFADVGVSGHKGKNHQTGALSLFLKACEQKRIARGSYLIVENLDRLSRENPLDALHLLRTLLKTHGITLVVIHPAAELTAANFDMLQGVLAFIEFSRGHSESAAKSARSKDNWKRKREDIKAGKVVTAKLPAWLELVGDKICVVEAKAKVVRQIFEWSASGYGQQVIVKKLREKGVPPITRSAVWHESYVQKLLESRAVLGEYQPFESVDGVRVAVGEPVREYYPPVVSLALWTRSREAMKSRRCQRGRISKKVGNLFTGLVWEGGERSHLTTKNSVPYLQPASKTSPGIRYDHFERAVLKYVREIQLTEGGEDDVNTLRQHADQLEKRIKQLKTQIDADPELADMLPTLAKWRREHTETLDKLASAVVPAKAKHLHTVRLIEALASAKGEELETLRRELRQSIRQVVERIDVTATGNKAFKDVFLEVRLHTQGVGYHLQYTAAGGKVLGVDPDPVADERERTMRLCWRLRSEGKSYKQITAETGLHRVTVCKYVRAVGAYLAQMREACDERGA